MRQWRIRDGQAVFLDRRAGPNGHVTTLAGVNLRIDDWRRGGKTALRLESRLSARPLSPAFAHAGAGLPEEAGPESPPAALSLSGTLTLAGRDQPLSASRFDGRLRLRGLSLDQFRPYGEAFGAPTTTGRLDLSLTGQGAPARFDVRAEASLAALCVSWPMVFPRPLTPGAVRVRPSDACTGAMGPQRRPAASIACVWKAASACALDTRDPICPPAFRSPLSLAEAGPTSPFCLLPRDTKLSEHPPASRLHRVTGGSGRLSRIGRWTGATTPGCWPCARGWPGILSFGRTSLVPGPRRADPPGGRTSCAGMTVHRRLAVPPGRPDRDPLDAPSRPVYRDPESGATGGRWLLGAGGRLNIQAHRSCGCRATAKATIA